MQIRDYLKEEEEGRVGTVNGLVIATYTEPLMNPSFHIRTKTFDRHWIYQIKDFKILEKKTQEGFSNKEFRAIVNWFKKKSEGLPAYTNWQILIYEWNNTNENNKLSLETKMPE